MKSAIIWFVWLALSLSSAWTSGHDPTSVGQDPASRYRAAARRQQQRADENESMASSFGQRFWFKTNHISQDRNRGAAGVVSGNEPALAEAVAAVVAAAGAADEDNDGDDDQNGDLNWREAQLARLHGLGPSEIAALSTWQQRLKSPPKRLPPPPVNNGQSDVSDADQSLALDRTLLWLPAQTVNDSAVPMSAVSLKRSSAASSTRSNGGGGKPDKSNKSGKSKSAGRAKEHRLQSAKAPMAATAASSSAAAAAAASNAEAVSGVKGIVDDNVSRMNRNLASQFLLRSPRVNQPYDVPIIGQCVNQTIHSLVQS